jgi:hypothetical protein
MQRFKKEWLLPIGFFWPSVVAVSLDQMFRNVVKSTDTDLLFKLFFFLSLPAILALFVGIYSILPIKMTDNLRQSLGVLFCLPVIGIALLIGLMFLYLWFE